MGSIAQTILSELNGSPLLGSEIRSRLASKGMNPASVGAEIRRLKVAGMLNNTPMTFTKRQPVYYLPGTDEESILSKQLESLQKCTKLYRLYHAVLKDQIITYQDALKITAAPEQQTSRIRERPMSRLLADLTQLGIAHEFTLGNTRFISSRKSAPSDGPTAQLHEESLSKEEQERHQILSFLLSFGVLRNPRRLDRTFPYFDIVGEAVSPKPIFVAIEVNDHRTLNRYDIAGMRERVFHLRRKLQSHPVVLYIFARFDKDAWEKANFMRWNAFPISRFEKLKSLIIVKGKGVITFQKQLPPKRIVATLEDWAELKKIGNFKARLFEADVRSLFDAAGFRTRASYKIFGDERGRFTTNITKKLLREFDVIATKESESENRVIIVECKKWSDPIDAAIVDVIRKKVEPYIGFLKNDLSNTLNPTKPARLILAIFCESFAKGSIPLPSGMTIRIFQKSQFEDFNRDNSLLEKEF